MSMLKRFEAGEIDLNPRIVGGKKVDRAYEIIKREILFYRNPPGAQLLETSLATEFGCSQGTVREALLRLAEDGLVERRGYQGTVVTNTSLEEASQMVLVRLSIERSAARTISARGLGDGRKALESLLDQMDLAQAVGDLFQACELDRTFHSQIARAAGMGLLSPILQRCALHIHRFTLSGVETPREFYQEAGVGAEHRALLDELTSNSDTRAETAISDHIARVLLRWAPSIYAAVGEDTFAVSG